MNPGARAALDLIRIHSDRLVAQFQFETTAEGVAIYYSQRQIRFLHSFLSGPFARRASQPNQTLLKACNNKQRNIKTLLDITAGWGMDSLSLASHGQQVTLLEQNPLVYAIVAYSLDCLAADPAGAGLTARLSLQQVHALDYLQALNRERAFDCIYLDPMFPVHKSTAKPSKALQILQALTENRDIDTCFELALQCAAKRVVVKRPARASTLGNLKPDLVYREKTVRFDVYLTA